jgi:hypothetical protein
MPIGSRIAQEARTISLTCLPRRVSQGLRVLRPCFHHRHHLVFSWFLVLHLIYGERAQLHHITCWLIAFCVLERERHERQLSIYQLKRQLSFRGRSFVLPALERLRSAA